MMTIIATVYGALAKCQTTAPYALSYLILPMAYGTRCYHPEFTYQEPEVGAGYVTYLRSHKDVM